MHQTLEKHRAIDKYPLILMFAIYFVQSVFFIYIDEGNYSLHQYQDFGTWVFTFGGALIFLLVGWGVYTIFNKKTSFDPFVKITLSWLLTIPAILLFFITIFLGTWGIREVVSLF